VRRQQHTVAENVAAHVANADDGEVLVARVDVDLAEVPFLARPMVSASTAALEAA
jgi:hypothetical protein